MIVAIFQAKEQKLTYRCCFMCVNFLSLKWFADAEMGGAKQLQAEPFADIFSTRV